MSIYTRKGAGIPCRILLSFADPLFSMIIAAEGPNSLLKRAVGTDWKGKLSPLIYIAAIVAAFSAQWIAQGLYVLVALNWLVPNRRIENALSHE